MSIKEYLSSRKIQGSYRVLNSWKSLKNRNKVWKIVKSLEFSSKLQQVLYKLHFFHRGKIFFNLPHTFVVHRKRALFLHFLRSVLITHLMTSSLEKMSWILDPKICGNPYNLQCMHCSCYMSWMTRQDLVWALTVNNVWSTCNLKEGHSSMLLLLYFLKIIAARNHVNRMCLAADVPLVESGTAGYLGQATVIKKV